MNKNIFCYLLGAYCLLLSGCMLTEKVKTMNTKEVIHYHASNAYLIDNNTLLVRNNASNNSWAPIYALMRTDSKPYEVYGTHNGVNYFNHSTEPINNYITKEYASNHYLGLYFPQCNITIKQCGFIGDTKYAGDISEFLMRSISSENSKSFVFGNDSDLCEGVEFLVVSDSGNINMYVKDNNNKDELVYSKHRFRDFENFYYGDTQTHLEILKYALLPFAFAADIATCPIQLFFLPYMVGGPGR